MNQRTKLGLFYFSNNQHYHLKERERWLPEILSLGVSWLILSSESHVAIPEPFIQALLENKITPIIRISQVSNPQKPDRGLELLIRTYASWGVQYIQLFDRPNTSAFWGLRSWVNGNIVEQFIDLFLPYAEILLKNKIYPIFPCLEVAKDYWDTAFLRLALESLVRRGHSWLTDHLILSGYVHLYDSSKPLTWGAGGQDHWPNTKPYHSQDHRGLYIADWYETIAKATLGKTLPIILMDDPSHKPLSLSIDKIQQRTFHAFQRLIDPRTNERIEIEGESFEPLATEILCLSFYCLACEPTEIEPRAWYLSNSQPQIIAEKIKAYWLDKGMNTQGTNKIPHVLFLPQLSAAQLNHTLEKMQPILIQYQPKLIFNLQEALQAEHVWFPVDLIQFTETEIEAFMSHSCTLHPISFNGTTIASQLFDPSLEVP